MAAPVDAVDSPRLGSRRYRPDQHDLRNPPSESPVDRWPTYAKRFRDSRNRFAVGDRAPDSYLLFWRQLRLRPGASASRTRPLKTLPRSPLLKFALPLGQGQDRRGQTVDLDIKGLQRDATLHQHLNHAASLRHRPPQQGELCDYERVTFLRIDQHVLQSRPATVNAVGLLHNDAGTAGRLQCDHLNLQGLPRAGGPSAGVADSHEPSCVWPPPGPFGTSRSSGSSSRRMNCRSSFSMPRFTLNTDSAAPSRCSK